MYAIQRTLRPATTLLCLIAVVALTGCVERWSKPGGTQQEFDATKAACGSRSYSRFPPAIQQVQVTSGYATPQLATQWDQAQKSLTYALSRSGLLNSSTAGQEESLAQQAHDQAAQQIQSTALDYANQARQSVASNRSSLVNELQATADPAAAAAGAAAAAQSVNALPAFSPLSALFQNVTSGLATAANVNPNGLNGALVNGFGGGFNSSSPSVINGPDSGSSRVVQTG